MKTKTIGILLFILLVLIGAWQAWKYYQQQQLNQITGWVTFSSNADADLVDKIIIDGTIELVKQENNWTLDGTNAKVDQVNQLLEVLRKPRVELVSQNQDRYQELGITDNLAKRVSFWQGENEKLVLLISDSNSAIIRAQDKQNVYRLTNRLNLNNSLSYWWAPSPTLGPSPTIEAEIENE